MTARVSVFRWYSPTVARKPALASPSNDYHFARDSAGFNPRTRPDLRDMANRIESTSGLYNFCSNSIPGLALLAGLLLVAPASWLDGLPANAGFTHVLFLAVAILTGFVVGQVVHSPSSSTEKFYPSFRETATAVVDRVSPLYEATVPGWLRRVLHTVCYPAVFPVAVADGKLTSSFAKQRAVFERTMDQSKRNATRTPPIASSWTGVTRL